MKTRHWLRFLAAGTALFAIVLFAACGGDDDDDGADNGDNGSESSDSTNTPGSGGGNTSSGGGNASSSEKKYVADICKATLKFTNAMSKIKPSDLTDESKVFEVLEEPYKEFVDGLEDADPPKDLKDYHKQALDQLKVILKAIEDEDQAAFESLGEADFPEPPADVQARLEKAASENEDCKNANVSFGE